MPRFVVQLVATKEFLAQFSSHRWTRHLAGARWFSDAERAELWAIRELPEARSDWRVRELTEDCLALVDDLDEKLAAVNADVRREFDA